MVQHGKRYAVKMLGEVPDTMLPDGWIGVYHISGAIVYLHRETRVVTWSRPYKISKETSLRAHNIPLISIPCLHQKLAVDRYLEKSDSTSGGKTCPVSGRNGDSAAGTRSCPVSNGDGPSCPKMSKVEEKVEGGSDAEDIPVSIESILVEDSIVGNTVGDGDGVGGDPSEATTTNGNTGPAADSASCNGGVKIEVENKDTGENEKMVKSDGLVDADVAIKMTTDHNNNGNAINKNVNHEIQNHDNINGTAEHSFIVLDETCEDEESSDTNDHRMKRSPNATTPPPTATTTTATNEELPSSPGCSRPLKRKLVNSTNDAEFNDVCRENDLLCSCRKTGNVDNPHEVTPTSMHEYLSEIFGFEIMSIEKFKGTVFSCKSHHPNYPIKEPTAPLDKKFNIVGKTPGQILNEYCQWRKTTVPAFTQVDRHSHHEFTVELTIENLKLGMGSGANLKQARHNAALHTLNILDHTILNEEDSFAHVAVFDHIPVDDKAVLPQIEKLSMTGVKLPYETLIHLLFRNFPGEFAESDIEFVVEELNPVRRKYTMRYKDYGVTGFCENWQPVREVAAQVLIAVMYPLIPNWGTVVRLVEGYIDVAGHPDLSAKKVRLKRGSESGDRRDMKR